MHDVYCMLFTHKLTYLIYIVYTYYMYYINIIMSVYTLIKLILLNVLYQYKYGFFSCTFHILIYIFFEQFIYFFLNELCLSELVDAFVKGASRHYNKILLNFYFSHILLRDAYFNQTHGQRGSTCVKVDR